MYRWRMRLLTGGDGREDRVLKRISDVNEQAQQQTAAVVVVFFAGVSAQIQSSLTLRFSYRSFLLSLLLLVQH